MDIGGVPVPLQAQVIYPDLAMVGTYVYIRFAPRYPAYVDQITGAATFFLNPDPYADYTTGGRCTSQADLTPGPGIIRLFNGTFEACMVGAAGDGPAIEAYFVRVYS